jgi:Fe-S cluster assembly scaffold protein SufB
MKKLSPMKSALLKPAPKIDLSPLLIKHPQINGAHFVQQKKDELEVDFTSTDIGNAASCIFPSGSDFSSRLHFRFQKHCRQMVFLRAEHFTKASIDLQITAEEKSEAHFVFLVKNHEKTSIHLKICGEVQENANLNITGLHMSKGQMNAEISINIMQKGASSEIRFAEIGQNRSISDIQIENISSDSHTNGNISTRCMLFDQAKARIQAVPTVQKKAEECENHLDQKTIILSPDARSESVPLLAIANNKVSASHKSSMARLDENDIFYFQSRGISRQSAKKLLLDGFLIDIFPKIPEESVKRCMNEAAQNFLEYR